MKKFTSFVGLDEAKDSIAVAIAEPGRPGQAGAYGTIANTPEALTKLV
jgi:transposase